MICRTCGRELQNDQAFCPNCGTINEQGQSAFYQTQTNTSQDRKPEEQQMQSNQSQTQQTQPNQSQQAQPNQSQQVQPNQFQGQQMQTAQQPYSNPAYRRVPPSQPYPYQPYQAGQGTFPPPLPPNAYVRSSKGPLYIFLAVYIVFLLIIGAFTIAVFAETVKQTESSVTDFNYDWNEDTVDPTEEYTVPYEDGEVQEESYNNLDYFITGREQMVFDLGQEISMENNLSFILDEINITDLGDGTSVFVAEISLKSEVEGNGFCLDDFLILPMDADYNMLADAMAAEYIMDSEGNELTTPLELPTEEYGVYTVSFILPMNTKNFTVYGTNYYNDEFAGPVYVCDMEVDD